MKRRNIIFLVLLGLAALLALFSLMDGKLPWTSKTVDGGSSTIGKGDPKAGSAKSGDAVNSTPKTASSPDMMRDGLLALNHQPIEFYGKAVDQYGNPVIDAEITGSVIVRDGFRETVEKYSTRTDAQGGFELKGFYGERLGIRIVRTGYEQDLHEGSSFKYSKMYRHVHQPDPKNPVIFVMWKLVGAETMICCDMPHLHIPYDGTSAAIDLTTGKIVKQGGDLRLTLRRDPVQLKFQQRNFDWSVTIEGVNGGVLESTNYWMYSAPEKGYQPQLKISMPSTSTNWDHAVERLLYVKSRGGRHHARVSIRIFSDVDRPGEGTGVVMESWLNPNGSRNLEFDSNKAVEPERIQEVGLEKALEEARVSNQSVQ